MSEGTELWLVRHGETEWSLSGQHTSRTDIPLTAHGRKRAEELRDFLKGTRFDAVFVSPLQRARETCAIAGFGDQAVVDDGLEARKGSIFALGTGSVSVVGWEREIRVIEHWNRGFED